MPVDFQRLGLGTYSDGNRAQWTDNVRRALDAGYRHVDTAEVYENESYVGEGIRRSDVPREDVFLATKTVHEVKPGPDREDVLAGVEGSLAWLLAKDNVAAIPKASSPAHLRENLAALELDLDDAAVARIDGIERERRIIDREYAPWNR